jgi:hypothetical protein
VSPICAALRELSADPKAQSAKEMRNTAERYYEAKIQGLGAQAQ